MKSEILEKLYEKERKDIHRQIFLAPDGEKIALLKRMEKIAIPSDWPKLVALLEIQPEFSPELQKVKEALSERFPETVEKVSPPIVSPNGIDEAISSPPKEVNLTSLWEKNRTRIADFFWEILCLWSEGWQSGGVLPDNCPREFQAWIKQGEKEWADLIIRENSNSFSLNPLDPSPQQALILFHWDHSDLSSKVIEVMAPYLIGPLLNFKGDLIHFDPKVNTFARGIWQMVFYKNYPYLSLILFLSKEPLDKTPPLMISPLFKEVREVLSRIGEPSLFSHLRNLLAGDSSVEVCPAPLLEPFIQGESLEGNLLALVGLAHLPDSVALEPLWFLAGSTSEEVASQALKILIKRGLSPANSDLLIRWKREQRSRLRSQLATLSGRVYLQTGLPVFELSQLEGEESRVRSNFLEGIFKALKEMNGEKKLLPPLPDCFEKDPHPRVRSVLSILKLLVNGDEISPLGIFKLLEGPELLSHVKAFSYWFREVPEGKGGLELGSLLLKCCQTYSQISPTLFVQSLKDNPKIYLKPLYEMGFQTQSPPLTDPLLAGLIFGYLKSCYQNQEESSLLANFIQTDLEKCGKETLEVLSHFLFLIPPNPLTEKISENLHGKGLRGAVLGWWTHSRETSHPFFQKLLLKVSQSHDPRDLKYFFDLQCAHNASLADQGAKNPFQFLIGERKIPLPIFYESIYLSLFKEPGRISLWPSKKSVETESFPKNPNSPESERGGLHFLKTGNWLEGANFFKMELKKNPNNPEAWVSFLQCLIGLKQSKALLKSYPMAKKAIFENGTEKMKKWISLLGKKLMSPPSNLEKGRSTK